MIQSAKIKIIGKTISAHNIIIIISGAFIFIFIFFSFLSCMLPVYDLLELNHCRRSGNGFAVVEL